MAFALAFALAPLTQAAPIPGGIPSASANQSVTSPEDAALPVISIHSAGNILRGKDRFIRLEDEPSGHVGWNVRQLQGQRHRCRRS